MSTSDLDDSTPKGLPVSPESLAAAKRMEQESNAILAAIVESSDDAIVSKTLDGVIRTWNKGRSVFLDTPPTKRLASRSPC